MSGASSGPLRLTSAAPDFSARFDAYVKAPRGEDVDVGAAVAPVIADVRARGLDAVLEQTQRWDKWAPTAQSLRVTKEELQAALQACPPDQIAALRLAAERIADYHKRQMPQDHSFDDPAGLKLGWRWTPVDSAGLYAPGGLAAYPSSILMNAVPARVAGVARLTLVSPTPQGKDRPIVLAAAAIAGVDEVWRIGGAQAIAALAYGAGPIQAVDKIVGPGNAYVAEAKRRVYGVVGIDALAGPSEILVIADSKNDPKIIAWDLLSQAEHDEAAQSVLITDDAAFADRVAAAVDICLQELETGERAGISWRNCGAIIVVKDLLAEAPALSDRFAPEHAEIACDPALADQIAAKLRHVGAIFIGRDAPEALGDYVTGSNHVLPTSRTARFASGLSVYDFLKRTAIQSITPQGLKAIGPAAALLARAEGLPAHALSVEARLRREDS
ncbi:MAG: histidinol dehydrogenase [Caulobacterales bacterium]